MDWQGLIEKKLVAPYIPEIRTDADSHKPADTEQTVESTIAKQDAVEALT